MSLVLNKIMLNYLGLLLMWIQRSYNGILIGTYSRHTQNVISNDL